MKLNIRQVKPEDIDRIAAMEEICFPPSEAASKEKYVWRQANYPEYFICGENDKEIVSSVNMIPMANEVIDDDIYEMEKVPFGTVCAILSVITDPAYQNQGAAEQVLNAAIEVARKQGMTAMALTCKERLIHYYAKFGFESLGVSKSVHGGAVWYDMIMKL